MSARLCFLIDPGMEITQGQNYSVILAKAPIIEWEKYETGQRPDMPPLLVWDDVAKVWRSNGPGTALPMLPTQLTATDRAWIRVVNPAGVLAGDIVIASYKHPTLGVVYIAPAMIPPEKVTTMTTTVSPSMLNAGLLNG
jgi:hypothetical protein